MFSIRTDRDTAHWRIFQFTLLKQFFIGDKNKHELLDAVSHYSRDILRNRPFLHHSPLLRLCRPSWRRTR